jgi:hypothetical protein
LLNNNELKLISYDDAYNFANEWYSVLRNNLNVLNSEFGASDTIPLSIIPGQAEYDLPNDFSDLLSITNWCKQVLNLITFRDIPVNADITTFDDKFSSFPWYYIRGGKIWFVPTPTEVATFTYRYSIMPPVISSLTDVLTLPNWWYYAVKDFMLSRAYSKLQNPAMSQFYMASFKTAVDQMKINAIKRDAEQASWWADPATLV